ncbi:MAG TPA: sugar ABC transporter ATP-binding protein, partial [Vicinamibacteria bacterium]|nr:sugar ABC transporter ATP-binding protein [Vicinamibacteria bacterium]
MTTPPALRLTGITKRFGPTVALDGAGLEVRAGEVHALIGENGAGKSTLLSCLAGLLRPEGGAMEVGGLRYAPASPREARERGIALIHQELSLFPHLSVAENIFVGTEPSRRGLLDRAAARRRTREVLAEFGHPEIDPEARVARLPLPARQVVEICRAIAARARLVLMDEPTSALQRPDVERLFAVIRRLAASGVAVVYISHFLEETREIASSYTVLRDGRSVGGGSLAATPNEELIAQMVGRTVDALFPRRAPLASAETLLEVRHLVAPPAVKEASFTIGRGEILGVFGLMGSGRTETVRALFGLDPAEGGTVSVRGRELPARGGDAAGRLAQGLGYLSEDRKGEGLALPMSVADNLTLTRLHTCARAGLLDRACQRDKARAWVATLGVKARTPEQPVRTLSGGNQQKVALGRLFHQEADVLLLDEPTRGIDIGSKAQIYEAVAEAAARGRGVLMVSSYLPELLGMCDRLAVMSRGRLSPARPVAEWTPASVMEAAIGA